MEATYNIHRDVVNRCVAGERSAYSELYGLYSKAMYNVSLRITHNEDDAEDVLQEAFISAFTNITKFKGDSTFGAWIKRIVINKAINHINKNKLDTTSVEEEGTDIEEDQPDDDVQYSVEGIRRAVEQLPKGYRLVFSLYLIEGYDHKEIAGILDITESTSKSQYNRSKKKIKEILKQEVMYGQQTKRSS